MPREGRAGNEGAREDSEHSASEAAPTALELTPDLKAALAPWIDLDEVGPEGLRSWLLTVVALLPRGSRDPILDRDVSRGSLEERVTVLARALADCASDRARKNFQASEYFRENRLLARRVKALEAMIRTRVATGLMERTDLRDPVAEAAARRYMPR